VVKRRTAVSMVVKSKKTAAKLVEIACEYMIS